MNPLRNPMPLDWYLQRFLGAKGRSKFRGMEKNLFQSLGESFISSGESRTFRRQLPNPDSKEGLILLRWLGQTLGAEGALMMTPLGFP
jgi:hypothetical protein